MILENETVVILTEPCVLRRFVGASVFDGFEVGDMWYLSNIANEEVKARDTIIPPGSRGSIVRTYGRPNESWPMAYVMDLDLSGEGFRCVESHLMVTVLDTIIRPVTPLERLAEAAE